MLYRIDFIGEILGEIYANQHRTRGRDHIDREDTVCVTNRAGTVYSQVNTISGSAILVADRFIYEVNFLAA